MEHQSSFSTRVVIFKPRIEAISTSILSLRALLEASEISHDSVKTLIADIQTFQYFLVLFSYHSTLDDYAIDSEAWRSIGRLAALLDNCAMLFDRLNLLFLNNKRSEYRNLKRYLQATKLEAEMHHLRLRLNVYITALSNPILLSAIYLVIPSYGNGFRHLAFKTASIWIDRLTKDCMELSYDDGISRPEDGSPVDPGSLFQQREDLIMIIQAMLKAAVQVIEIDRNQTRQWINDAKSKGSNEDDNFQAKPVPRRASVAIGALDNLDTNSRDHFSSYTERPQSYHLSQASAYQRTMDISQAHSHEGLSGHGQGNRSIGSMADIMDLSHPFVNLFLSGGTDTRPDLEDNDEPPEYRAASSNTIDRFELFQTTGSDTVSFSETGQVAQSWRFAKSCIADADFDAAITHLESMLDRSSSLYSFATQSWYNRVRTHFVIALAQCYTLTVPKQITRARQVLKRVHASGHAEPKERRYEAAHMLAKLYTPDDFGTRGEYAWLDADVNLDEAKKYVIAAVKGRKKLLGLAHKETQESIELLTNICESLGQNNGPDMGGLLEVLKSTFENTSEE